jgi:hypothetical protein
VEQREAWLKQHVAHDAALLASVQDLLRLDAQNDDGLLDGARTTSLSEQPPTRG